jgi:inorganic pyrophosphatase
MKGNPLEHKTTKSKSLELARSFLGKEVEVTMDRPLGSKHPDEGFLYEVNYGYIAGVIAPDGEDLDAYYLASDQPLEKAKGKVIAIIHREDDDDDKLVVVPKEVTLSDEEITKLVSFQEQRHKSFILRK